MTLEENDGLHADPDSAHQQPQTNGAASSSKITIIRSIGVVVSLVTVVVCSYLLFNLFKDNLEVPVIDALEQQFSNEPVVSPEIDISTPLTEQIPAAEIAEPAPQIPLPELNNSDEEIQQAGRKLNPALKWADWITTEEAIRKFVVVIDNLAQGKIAKKYLPIPKPEHKFKHRDDGIKVFLDPAGFERYTPYISLFENIDNQMASALYQRYLPLMEQAFAELGYPDRNFHVTLIQAFDVLLNTPIMEEEIELVRPSVLYKFAYPTLENASAAHKQLIRMGPDNTRWLQEKIQQLKTALSAIKQPSLSP